MNHVKETVFVVLGVAIIIFEVINSEVLGRPFHYEFLLLAGGLCGIGITQLGDRG